MQIKKVLLFKIFLVIFTISIFGQTATKIEIQTDENSYNGGKLFVTINGKQRRIANNARDAWIVSRGKEVVYSINEMLRGFEGEGETLFIYDVKSGKTRKIMAEYTFVMGLSEVKLSNGATAFLIRMGDGGLGGSYFAVVDPKRGQVLQIGFAELIDVKGDVITLAHYKTDDWEVMNDERDWIQTKSQNAFAQKTTVKPEKVETLDLKNILKNKVIVNKTNEELGREYERKYKNVVVYLWRPNDSLPDKDFFVSAVRREMSSKIAIAPLRPTLENLFQGATKQDEASGFSSSTFGMKFEGVVLNNGVATVKFSQPKGETNHGSLAPAIFLDAIERTAKQFPTVKKVVVCAIGETLIDAQLEEQFPRCK